jgi:hypothetical protein
LGPCPKSAKAFVMSVENFIAAHRGPQGGKFDANSARRCGSTTTRLSGSSS